MEIKRPVSNVPAELQEINFGQTEEKAASEKPAGVASVADSLEVAKSKTDQSFSEIYQSAQQTGDTTGQKELSPEEQQQVSIDLEDLKIVDKPGVFVQDGKSRYEDAKNSGLTAPYSQATGGANSQLAEKVKRLTQEEIFNLNTGANSAEQTSDAVKDAERLLRGGNLRDAVNEEVAERHEELDRLGGSQTDRLRNILDPTAREPQTSGPTYGKGMISGLWQDIKDFFGSDDDSKIPPGVVEVIEHYTPVPVPPTEKDEYENTGIGLGYLKVLLKRDYEKHVDGRGGIESYDPENYEGNIPKEIKQQMEQMMEELRALKQNPGGEQVQEDPNAIGGSKIDDGRLHLAEMRITGLVGQPVQDGDQPSGLGGSTQPGGASGGDIDWENRTGFSGPTHQDDPGNVQFGPATPLEQAADTEEEDDATKSSLSFNILEQLRQKKTE